MSQSRHAQRAWELSLPDGSGQPSDDLLHLLVHGDPLRAPESVAASCLLGVWNAVGDWDRAVQVVAGAPALQSDLAKQSRGLSWLRRVQRHCEAVATDAPNRDRAHQVRADLADAHRRAEVRQWPRLDGHRVSAASVTRVLRAVLTVAGEAGRTRGLHLAVRTVAERAGVSRGTAQSALTYLQAARVLVRLDRHQVRDGQARAATYSLELDRYVLPDDSAEDTHTVQVAAASLLSHDTWRWRGLGGSAGHVWVLLSDTDGLTAEQVAALRGRSVSWTARLLGRLAQHGLAVRRGDTWTRCTLAEAQHRLDVAARHVGTAGKGEAVRVKHEQERAAWSEARTRWVATRTRDLHQPVGVVQDPATGAWVDLATGERVAAPAPVPPPVLDPVAVDGVPLAARAEDDTVQVTAVLLGGVPQPLPRTGQPVVLDLTDPDDRGVPARVELCVPVGTLGLQQQAERIQQTLAQVTASPRLQELATQLQDTFAHLADVGRPLQDLAARLQDTVTTALNSAEEGRDDRDPRTP